MTRSSSTPEEPRGESLEGELGAPMDVERFLSLGIGIAVALGKLHRGGFIHGDIRPGNIRFNSASGEVALSGLSVASSLLCDRQSPDPPESMGGSLPYMAPEQTGRMNRSIDSRSDLYSVGVIYYQMLTGRLPFTASDPMEWVHSHIARMALAPCEVRRTVPVPLSAIVMRLLAKTPEDRYQTAAGVESDLKRCLVASTQRQHIDDFPLGENEVADRLHATAPERAQEAAISPSAQHLDIGTMIKASQTVSSETVLPRLIERLMTIALQSAGADRGLLLLPSQSGYEVAAEAWMNGEKVMLRHGSAADVSAPESVVRYVIRSLQRVILDDAVRPNLFSEDSYLARRQPKSLLCLPLVRQGALAGMLYLENTLASYAFTARHMELLEVLASQAAMSLENTRLHRDLQERDASVLGLQTELAHANRVATLGQLSASIAHEITQPIAAMVTNARAAMRWQAAEPPDKEEVRQALERITRDGIRAFNVVSQVRALFKKAPPRRDALPINDSIQEVIALTRRMVAKSRISLRSNLAESLPLIQGDRVQLQQVVLNLIMNAVEAMGDIDESSREMVITTNTGDGDVQVTVQDSGPGLSSSDAEKVFEAFFTTKTSGLGIGLSVCRSIIEAHGGRLWASANVPRGAVFQFTLPVPENIEVPAVG
jgi:signal transduction histidine kinase